MTLNSLIQPSRPTVANLVEGLRNKTYFVDNSFQRRLVWTEKQKVRLIETIIMGYPMPEIYLWQQTADPDTGRQINSIVDGQQRMTTMLQFVSNEWPLKKAFLDNKKNEDIVDKHWKDLSADYRRKLWDYVMTVRTIPSDVTEAQVRDVFTRLNETDRSLNPQELRNARFSGQFLRTSIMLANSPEFGRLEIFPDRQIRRMADVEFISGLLMFLRRGMIEENTTSINETYDLYNDIYDEREQDVKAVKDFLHRCSETYLTDGDVRRLFLRPIHLYTLFCVEQALLEQGFSLDTIAGKLKEFAESYNQPSDAPELIKQYRLGAAYRTRSRSSRALRASNLLKWIRDSTTAAVPLPTPS